jgi:diaminopimelate epimerase
LEKDSTMRFTKMHGIGNDYVYVNGFEESLDDPAAVARRVSDRHRAVGSDGLILILPSEAGDVQMRMFNADGSEGEMCGNGIRCVAKFAWDHALAKSNPMRIETAAGVKSIDLQLGEDGKVVSATVDLGAPMLDLPEIPVDESKLPVTVDGRPLEAHFVSMGNPHAVIFVEDVDAVPLETLGPRIETHEAFPNRINVHVVQAQSPRELTMRTWERGSGLTLACGTGACAVCVAGVRAGRAEREALLHLPGGDLRIEWREADNRVCMTGPAAEVFTGRWAECSE